MSSYFVPITICAGSQREQRLMGIELKTYGSERSEHFQKRIEADAFHPVTSGICFVSGLPRAEQSNYGPAIDSGGIKFCEMNGRFLFNFRSFFHKIALVNASLTLKRLANRKVKYDQIEPRINQFLRAERQKCTI